MYTFPESEMRKRVPDVAAVEACWFMASLLFAWNAKATDKRRLIFLASMWPFAAIVAGVDGQGVWGEGWRDT